MTRDTEFFKINFEEKYSTYNNGGPLFVNGRPTNVYAEQIVFFENQEYSEDFWVLNTQIDTKETGKVWPQIKSIETDSELFLRALQDLTIAKELEEKAKIKPYEFILYSKAKLTDILSWSSPSMLINQKTHDIFTTLNLADYVAIPVSVKNNRVGSHQYYYCFLYNNFSEKIDFEDSVFYKTIGIKIDWDSDFQLRSFSELQNLREQYRQEWEQSHIYYFERPPFIEIRPKKLFIDKQILTGIDLFNLKQLGTMEVIYISKYLKDVIEEHKLTGFDLRRTKILYAKNG